MDQPNDRSRNALRRLTRRHFFEQASFGIGGLALASLFDRAVCRAAAGARRRPA